MAWTAPMTAADNTIWTSAQWNTHVRDNLAETCAAKATATGNWFVTTGTANQIAERVLSNATVATSQATSTTTYTDLATTGPAVTVTTGTSAIVFWASECSNSTANAFAGVSVAISGATTLAADGNWSAFSDGLAAGNAVRIGTFYKFENLTAGSNTFTMKYRAGSSTATFANREIMVLPL